MKKSLICLFLTLTTILTFTLSACGSNVSERMKNREDTLSFTSSESSSQTAAESLVSSESTDNTVTDKDKNTDSEDKKSTDTSKADDKKSTSDTDKKTDTDSSKKNSSSKTESVKVVELKASNGYVICPDCSYVYKKGSECPVCKGDKNKPNTSCPTCKGGYIVQTGTHSTHCSYCNKDFQCCPAGTLHCSACGLCGAPYGKGEGENYYLATYGYCSSCTNAYVLPSTCQYCGNTLTSDYEKNLSMCNTCITMRTCRICGQIKNDVFEGYCASCEAALSNGTMSTCQRCGKIDYSYNFNGTYCNSCSDEYLNYRAQQVDAFYNYINGNSN